MDYKMEELLPIVSRLVDQYTSFESTSVTYEKAEQLMGAVLYCIHETEHLSGCNALKTIEKVEARQAYQTGVGLVESKVQTALQCYNEMLPNFQCYGNHCLQDTFVKAIPEFFQWYDIKFDPQNTIITLDYPVLEDLTQYSGIDKIDAFIRCVGLEQEFLSMFPEVYVIHALQRYNPMHQDLIENLCEIVLMSAAGHLLAKKPFAERDFDVLDYAQIQKMVLEQSQEDVKNQLKEETRAFVQKYCQNSSRITAYLENAIDNIAVRIKNAAENDVLSQLF